MSKVLQRAMFKKPQHEHRSTGIASGLEYREGYAVGGQVTTPKRGLVDGPGGYAGHNKDIPLQNINPNLGTGLGGIDLNKIMEFSKQQQADLFPPIEPIDYTQFERDFSKYKTDYSGLEPSRLGAVGEAAALTIGEPIPEGQSQFAKFIANLNKTSGDFKATRENLDLMAKEEQEKIAAEAKKTNQKTFNIDRTMEIVEQNTRNAPGFSDLPEEAQSELIRFARMDELGNNQMTKSINAYNEMYLENFSLDPSNPVLSKPDMERKRQGLIQYMTGLYPGYDFELIFPESDLNPDQEKLTSSFKSFFPNISDDDMKIIETNIEDKLFDQLITTSQRKKDGETFIQNLQGGTVDIDEVLNEIKSQLSIKYPDLNLGD